MSQGTVKWFSSEKGYGFIKLSDGRDVFFHYSQLVMDGFKTIEENAEVEFDLIEGDRGKLTFQGTRYLGFERTRENLK